MNAEHRDDDRQRRRLGHVHPVKERVAARHQRSKPDQLMSDSISPYQPRNRKNGERPIHDRRDLRRRYRLKEPQERYLQEVKKEMMVGVIVRIQNRQRQPFERRQPLEMLDVIVPVPIAAADRRGPRLKERHHHRDSQEPEDQIDHPYRVLGLEIVAPRQLGRGRFYCRNIGIFVDDFFHSKGKRTLWVIRKSNTQTRVRASRCQEDFLPVGRFAST